MYCRTHSNIPNEEAPKNDQSDSDDAEVVTPISKGSRAKSRKAESLPEIMQNYVEEKKKRRVEKEILRNSENPVIEFFTNMGKTVATFSPLGQARTKSQVFSIVSTMEIEHLSSSSLTPVTTRSTTPDLTVATTSRPTLTNLSNNSFYPSLYDEESRNVFQQ